jgi:hypothetical protein
MTTTYPLSKLFGHLGHMAVHLDPFPLSFANLALNAQIEFVGRGARIRTEGLCFPKAALCQTELRPVE